MVWPGRSPRRGLPQERSLQEIATVWSQWTTPESGESSSVGHAHQAPKNLPDTIAVPDGQILASRKAHVRSGRFSCGLIWATFMALRAPGPHLQSMNLAASTSKVDRIGQTHSRNMREVLEMAGQLGRLARTLGPYVRFASLLQRTIPRHRPASQAAGPATNPASKIPM